MSPLNSFQIGSEKLKPAELKAAWELLSRNFDRKFGKSREEERCEERKRVALTESAFV